MTDESDKVDLETPDLAVDYRSAMEAIFPGALTDGVLDADLLALLLGVEVAHTGTSRDRYGLQWAGKQDAIRSLLAPSRATLSPDVAASVDFDRALNVFIEGDNLEVLKLLQKAYNDQIKVIYIDPPYNTGKDFVYADNFGDGLRGYLEYTGQLDESGNQRSAIRDSTGRKHSRWLSMMVTRLGLARNLLTQDGLIFISIDDNEVAQLKLLMDEYFGPENFVETYIWESTFRPDNSSPVERENAQYVVCYARNRQALTRLVGEQKKSEGLPSLTMSKMPEVTVCLTPEDVDFRIPDGIYGPGDMGSGYALPQAVVIRKGKATAPFKLTGRIKWSQRYLSEQLAKGTRIIIKSATFVPYSKKAETAALPPTSLLPRDLIPRENVGDILASNAELRALFDGKNPFDYPKPTSLIKFLVNAATHSDPDAVILDFFAGSGTTAHAVALLNAEDGGRRRTISVTLPEPTPVGSVAFDLGLERVSDITLARIKRAMDRDPVLRDQGLRVYALAPSNFRNAPVTDGELDLSVSTLVSPMVDRDAVIAEVLLKEGVALETPWHRLPIGDVFVCRAGRVAVVFGKGIDLAATEEVFRLDPKPHIVVFLEDDLAGQDALKANLLANLPLSCGRV